MNKKGAVIGIISVLGVVAAFVVYFSLINQSPAGAEEYLGVLQLSVLKAFGNAESKVAYVEKSIKLSSEQAIYELGLNGGYSKDKKSKCGSIKENNIEYYIWSDKNDKDCYPEVGDNILGENYFTYFDNSFNDMLKNSEIRFDKDDFNCNLINEDNEFVPVECKGLIAIEEPIIIIKKVEMDVGELVPTGYKCWGGCKLRGVAAEKLKEAEKLAKEEGVELSVISAWRSIERQTYLWNKFGRDLVRVARPSQNAPHVRGCAVDIELKGKLMDTKNKALLNDIMIRAGWVRYEAEWWHFEYGTKRWAGTKGEEIICGSDEELVELGESEPLVEPGYFVSDKEIDIGTYSTDLNFKINSNYNFIDYDLIADKVKECNQLKIGVNPVTQTPTIEAPNLDEIESCVSSGNNFQWFIRQEGDYFLFDVITDKIFLVFNGEKYNFENVIIRFAVESKESLVPEVPSVGLPGISPLPIVQ